ncbi:MAG: CDP-alcohol phosphatidyltransferase [Thiotrichales bacterium]|nr:MAG: CDP-alcohol phosphatidyltransferase [Thiotrichales bacterium]
MIDSYFAPSLQKYLVLPVVKKLPKHISANHITFLGVLFGVLGAITICWNYKYLAVGLLLASGYCDNLDGCLARYRNLHSNKGAVLDIFSDRVVEFAILLALYITDPARAFVIICMLGSVLLCVTAFLTVAIFQKQQGYKSFHYSVGLMERTEAFILFGLMVLLPQYFYLFAWSFVVLVTLSAVLHILRFLRLPNSRTVTD